VPPPRRGRRHGDDISRKTAPSGARQAALDGNSESARVSASRVLLDALHEPRDEEDWRTQQQQQMHVAAERFTQRITERCERMRAFRRKQLAEIVEPVGLVDLLDLEKDEDELVLVRELVARLAAIPEHVRQEHAPSRKAVCGGLRPRLS